MLVKGSRRWLGLSRLYPERVFARPIARPTSQPTNKPDDMMAQRTMVVDSKAKTNAMTAAMATPMAIPTIAYLSSVVCGLLAIRTPLFVDANRNLSVRRLGFNSEKIVPVSHRGISDDGAVSR